MIESDLKARLDRDGFAVVKGVVEAPELKAIIDAIDAIGKGGGAGLRGLLRQSDWISTFAEDIGGTLLAQDFGVQPHPVRAILFAKTNEANWYVRWHQDRTIPVEERRHVEGFTAWSEKDGVIHCYPPTQILERMISIRIHIDRAREQNGAIKFIKGSHAKGILSDEEKQKWKNEGQIVTAAAEPGDVILMRPLILHASSKARSDEPRRVLHIEYAMTELPSPLKWGRA